MTSFIRDRAGPVGTLGVCLMLTLSMTDRARAQQPASAPAPADAAVTDGPQESLTVHGHHSRFEAAPMPGPAMPPPPDKPPAHLGRYKISGDQEKHDGIDAQTGAQIGQFGTAYTGASPVSEGLASRYGH